MRTYDYSIRFSIIRVSGISYPFERIPLTIMMIQSTLPLLPFQPHLLLTCAAVSPIVMASLQES